MTMGNAERALYPCEEEMLAYVRRVARSVMRKWGNALSEDDLVAYGIVGYLEAIERYDPNRSTSVWSYAFGRTYGSMVDGARKWCLRRSLAPGRMRPVEETGLSAKIGRHLHCKTIRAVGDQMECLRPRERELGSTVQPWYAGLSGQRVVDCTGDESAMEARRVWRKVLRAVQGLSRHEQILVDLYHLEGRSMQDVADVIGCSRSWVCRLNRRVLRKIRARVVRDQTRCHKK